MATDPAADAGEPKSFATSPPFGPGFFLGQLGAFARERCPDPGEALPVVEVHLATGEVLDLCHIIGLAPAFVALAVREGPRSGTGDMPMRTELVPYGLVIRVTIRAARAAGGHVGFDVSCRPDTRALRSSPEETLRAAADRTSGDPRREGGDAARVTGGAHGARSSPR
jgi:hypothetical protein